MSALAIKKWEGPFSVVWVGLGALFFTSRRDHLSFGSLYVMFLAVFVVWWGVGLLFAASGLRSGSRVGMLCGWCTILGFLVFLWWALVPRVHG